MNRRTALATIPLALLVILPAATLAAWGHFDGLYGQDPYAYFAYATGPLRASLRHFQPPPPFYWPPGYPLLVVLATEVIGARPLAGQLVSLVAGGLVPIFTALLARDVWPAEYGKLRDAGALLAGVLVACGGQLWQSSYVVMADTTALAAATAGMWAVARYGRRETAGYLLLAAAALAWAILTRWAYLLVALPAAACAALVLARRVRGAPLRMFGHGAVALLLAGLLLGPVLLPAVHGLRSTPDANAPFAADLQVYRWQPWNAFRRTFVTADGLLAYRQPNGLYYTLAPARPTFFTPLLAWLIAPGLWVLLRRPAPAPLLLVVGWAAMVWAFHAGAPWQNIRFVLAYAPPCAILIALGFLLLAQTLGRVGRGSLFILAAVGLLWMLGSGVQLAREFIARKDADLAIVRAVSAAAPPAARLLTFGPTLAFQHYTGLDTRDLSALTEADLAQLLTMPQPLLLLVDTANLDAQWQGRAPATNTAWLRAGPGLTTLGQYGPYTLYRVGAGHTP